MHLKLLQRKEATGNLIGNEVTKKSRNVSQNSQIILLK